MQGNVDALNKNAFISMFIQKPLSKEHPVLACVCVVGAAIAGGGALCWGWECGAGSVEMGCAGLGSCMQ